MLLRTRSGLSNSSQAAFSTPKSIMMVPLATTVTFGIFDVSVSKFTNDSG